MAKPAVHVREGSTWTVCGRRLSTTDWVEIDDAESATCKACARELAKGA